MIKNKSAWMGLVNVQSASGWGAPRFTEGVWTGRIRNSMPQPSLSSPLPSPPLQTWPWKRDDAATRDLTRWPWSETCPDDCTGACTRCKTRVFFLSLLSAPSCNPVPLQEGLSKPLGSGLYYPIKAGANITGYVAYRQFSSSEATHQVQSPDFSQECACNSFGGSVHPWHLFEKGDIYKSVRSQTGFYF